MPRKREILPVSAASCAVSRELVAVNAVGAIVDPDYHHRERYRVAMYKAHADGPPKQCFSMVRDGTRHRCEAEAEWRPRDRWARVNPDWPWHGAAVGTGKGGGRC